MLYDNHVIHSHFVEGGLLKAVLIVIFPNSQFYPSFLSAVCKDHLGMDSNDQLIPEENIFVTSSEPGKGPADLRLNGPDAWSPNAADTTPSVVIDLGSPARLTGIIVQGGGPNNPDEYVKLFEVEYSPDGSTWNPVGINNLVVVSFNIKLSIFY